MTSSTKRVLGPCLVCGAESIGLNFGVPTCMPCKAFFRRNAVKICNYEFICSKDGDCPITPKCRLCNCCRLAKCFRVGMQKELILSAAEKEQRRQIIEQNRQRRDQCVKIKSLALIRPSNLLRSTNSQSRCLSPSDQTLLTSIFSAYERTCIVTRKNACQYFPSKPHTSIHTIFNDYSDRHLSLIEYLKLIPEFCKLSINDKACLLRNHFGETVIINESPNSPDRSEDFLLALKIVYGNELSMNLWRSIHSLQKYGRDPIILKLLLIIRSLSYDTNRHYNEIDLDRIYDDSKCIFAGQNIYVELLWKYILSRLPSERDVVKFFNQLILDVLFMMRVIFAIEDLIYSSPDEIDKMEPLMQSMWSRSNTKTI